MSTSPNRRSRKSSNSTLLGNPHPRIATPPLRDLADPAASYGHAVVRFADRVLKQPLYEWQRNLVVRAGELTEDGLPRYRQVLTIVARQAGKSHLCRVLANFWLFAERQPAILGVANKLSVARKQWLMTVRQAQAVPALAKRIASVREANGQESIVTVDGCEYGVDAAGSNCGRGLTLSRIIWDERRQEKDLETDGALLPTMAAVEDAQLWTITNQGTDASVSLNDARAAGLAGTDPTLGLFEWSAPEDADPLDPEAWAAANPSLGVGVLLSDMESAAHRAVAAGGEQLALFKTERLCIPVRALDSAIDAAAWERCRDPATLDGQRDRLYACLDVALDELHATLAVAAMLPDGRVRVEVVRDWSGRDYADQVAGDLPALLEKIRPRSLGWLATGPAASLTPTLRRRQGWPAAVVAEEIRADLPTICMSFASLVEAKKVAHSGQPLLDNHAKAAERLRTGDRWTFSRRGAGGVDALYAAAGAAYLAQSAPPVRRTVLPTPLGQMRDRLPTVT